MKIVDLCGSAQILSGTYVGPRARTFFGFRPAGETQSIAIMVFDSDTKRCLEIVNGLATPTQRRRDAMLAVIALYRQSIVIAVTAIQTTDS